MQTAFEEHGRWWLPHHELLSKQPFYGKLIWNPVKGATIEVTGVSQEVAAALASRFGKLSFIQGQLDTIPCITLEDARIVSLPSVLGSGQIKIVCESMIKGDEVPEKRSQVMMKGMSCEFSGLDLWTRSSAIHVVHPEPRQTLVDCHPYEDQLFTVVDGIEIRIAIWNRISEGRRSFSAETVNSIELEGENHFPYEKGRQVLDEFKAFLTLALDRPVIFDAIRGRLPDSDQKFPDGRAITRHVEFYQTTDEHTAATSKEKRNEDRIPFFLQPIERSAQAFQAFRKIYRENRMALDFFFSQTYGSQSYINQQFADMVHGLEGLHRGLRGGTFMDPIDFNSTVLPALISGIPRGIEPELRQALKKRLEFGNEYSLRRRIKDMARFHHEYASGCLGPVSDFADAVTEMRNRLAHASGSEPPNRETVTRYFILLHRVRLLFQLELFHHLGFDFNFLKGCIPRLRSAKFAVREL